MKKLVEFTQATFSLFHLFTKSKPLPLVVVSNLQTKSKKDKQTKIGQVDKLKSLIEIEVLNNSTL